MIQQMSKCVNVIGSRVLIVEGHTDMQWGKVKKYRGQIETGDTSYL